MNPIKSITMITFIIFISGFVVWQIMSMNELGEKYNIDHLSDYSHQKKELKDNYIKYHKEKIENNRHIDEKEPILVQESQTIKKHFGKALHERENPENTRAELRTQLSRETKKTLFKEESGERIDNYNHGDPDLENKQSEAKSDRNKSMSITQKNNTISVTIKNDKKPVTQKNTGSQKHIKALNGKVVNTTQHPTSTIRQW